MRLSFYHYNFILMSIAVFALCSDPNHNLPTCTICLELLGEEYSVDAWGNPFHSEHEKEGIFCHSCSRIISQGITQGGYRYTDGRHLCSLCQVSVVEKDHQIRKAYQSVLKQLSAVGFKKISELIPVELVNLNVFIPAYNSPESPTGISLILKPDVTKRGMDSLEETEDTNLHSSLCECLPCFPKREEYIFKSF